MSYLGVPPFGQSTRNVQEFIATAGQTTFGITGGYVTGYVDVFINGIQLYSYDYTASNNADIVLTTGAIAGDEIKVITHLPSLIQAAAQGGGNNTVFFENDINVTEDYTITSGKNAMSAGPITINTGVTVTVPTGSEWTIV